MVEPKMAVQLVLRQEAKNQKVEKVVKKMTLRKKTKLEM